MVALASRWVLDKYYMWLEWVALIILTLASAAFGYLQQMEKKSAGGTIDMVAILCVLGSAMAACFNSLIMERLMKDEDEPFHVQKVRFDAGTVIWSILFLPVMGGIATDAKYKFWMERPLTSDCDAIGVCVDGAFVAHKGNAAESTSLNCKCGGGGWDIFVGWNQKEVYLAL